MLEQLQQWLVREVLSPAYEPETDEPIAQWISRNVELSKKESIEHSGQYDVSLTPWVAWIWDQVQHRTFKELHIKKSSQSGVTLGILLLILWLVRHRPVNMLYAIDSVPEARKISKARLQPLLEECTGTKVILDNQDEDDVTNLFFNLPDMQLHLTGSYSAGTFANKSIGAIILDELDLHPPSPQGEPDSVDLARDRIKNVAEGFLITFSKPKNHEDPITRNYLTGTRHQIFVPCPHCGTMQVLRREGLRYDHCKDTAGEHDRERILHETYYQCANELCANGEECGRIYEKKHKGWMLARMEVRQTNFGTDPQDPDKPYPGRLSLEVTDLYARLGDSTWGRLALEWHDAQGDDSKMKRVLAGRFAQGWKNKKTEVGKKQVYALCGGYEHRCIPRDRLARDAQGRPAITMQIDVQGSGLKKWVKMGFAPSGEAWVIDYGATLSYEELSAVADEPVRLGMRYDDPGLEEARVVVGLIDEGHETMKVRDWCLTTRGRFHPCKGRGNLQVREVVELKERVPHEGREVDIYHFSDDDFKRDLYRGRIGEFERIKAGVSPIPRLWLPVYPDDSFVDELCQERMVQEKVRGRVVWKWADPAGPNDFGDGVKMGLVLWYVIKPFFQPSAIPQKKAA